MNCNDYLEQQKKAMILLMDYGLNDIPINIHKVMELMNIDLIPYSNYTDKVKDLLLKESEEGFYWFDETINKFKIFYNDNKSKTRIKFTFGHETSHIIDLDTIEDEEIKIKANYFSRFLLVPIPLIYELGITESIDIEDIFQVSPDVAKYSLEFCSKNKIDFDRIRNTYDEFIEFFSESIKECRETLCLRHKNFYDFYYN